MLWTYGENGDAIGFTVKDYEGVEPQTYTYYYIKNAQGDVLRVVDETGATMADYTYDAWGNFTFTPDPNAGANAGIIEKYNPVTYRGYYYDTDLEMYYLKSRYYNPRWGRFLNADDGIDIGAGLIGTNLYSYCANNPANKYDPTGEFAVTITTCIIVGAVAGVATGGGIGAYFSHNKFGKISWKYVAVGAATGGIAGGLVGWGAGAILAHFGAIAVSSSITAGGGVSFETFQKLKQFLGSPGAGNQWHHIVEQCQEVKSGFMNSWINNSNNVINISTKVHQRISAYYSSIPKEGFTNGLRVRDWLAGQSFQQQYEFGVKILKIFGVII